MEILQLYKKKFDQNVDFEDSNFDQSQLQELRDYFIQNKIPNLLKKQWIDEIWSKTS